MKKVISILVLFLAFSFGAIAQTAVTPSDAVTNIEAKAAADVTLIGKSIELVGPMAYDLNNLFLKKHTDLSKEGITQAEKEEVYAIIDAKLRATFNADTIAHLKFQAGLYEALTRE
jgi:hypothetical protein